MKVLLGLRFRAASIAIASLALATACDSEVERIDQQMLVGLAESEGQATSIALSLEDGHVVAYVCGEQTSLESNTGWLEGELMEDGSFDLSANGLRLRGTVRYVSAEAAFTPYYALTQKDRSRLAYLAEITLDDAVALPAGLPVQVFVPVSQR